MIGWGYPHDSGNLHVSMHWAHHFQSVNSSVICSVKTSPPKNTAHPCGAHNFKTTPRTINPPIPVNPPIFLWIHHVFILKPSKISIPTFFVGPKHSLKTPRTLVEGWGAPARRSRRERVLGLPRAMAGKSCGTEPGLAVLYYPIWLVVWLPFFSFSRENIGNFIIPIDELTNSYFQRGGPTTNEQYIGDSSNPIEKSLSTNQYNGIRKDFEHCSNGGFYSHGGTP